MLSTGVTLSFSSIEQKICAATSVEVNNLVRTVCIIFNVL